MGSDPIGRPHEVRDLIFDGVRRVGERGLGDEDDYRPRAIGVVAAGITTTLPAGRSPLATMGATVVMQQAWDEGQALHAARESRRRPATE